MRQIFAFAIVAPLLGCAGVSVTTAGDAIGCATALASAGVANPAGISALAFSTSSCQGLAKDVLDTVIAQAQTKAAATRRQMRLAP